MKTIFTALLLIGSAAALLYSSLPAPDPTGTIAIRKMESQSDVKKSTTDLIADPSGTIAFRRSNGTIDNP